MIILKRWCRRPRGGQLRPNYAYITRFVFPFSLVNTIGGWLSDLDLPLATLQEESLLCAASRQVGRTDFGGNEFREGLRRLLGSVPGARLHFIGRLSLQFNLVNTLANRLRFLDQRERCPNALDCPVRSPLVIIGLARSGTTLLQRLLAQDPNALYLPLWLQLFPMPPPSHEEWKAGGGSRLKRARRWLSLSPIRHTALDVRHEVRAEHPEECSGLMAGSFVTRWFWDGWPVYDHALWWLSQDLLPAYRLLADQLKLLQHPIQASHWVLKDPGHMLGLKTLLRVMPDARIVHTHRDPAKALGSLPSVTLTTHGMFAHTLEVDRTVDLATRMMAEYLRRSLVDRDSIPEDRILNVRFKDLISNPLRTARHIYCRFGYEWKPEVERRMRAYLAAHPRHRYGRHDYQATAIEQLPKPYREPFVEYTQRYLRSEDTES